MTKPTYALVTLGCPKNLVDSERMAGLLGLDGYEMVREPEGSDFVVVNTCAFIGDSRSESHAVIREMLDLKKDGRTRGVIVTGCLAQREKEKLLEMYPGVDQLVGVFGREDIAAAAQRLVTGLHEQRTVFRPAPTRALPDTHRLRITPRHLAFLKISEGCNRACSFCSIPQMRGKHASKPIEEVVAEAEELVADGAKELVVVAQDTTFYGMDIYDKPRLDDLLRQARTHRRVGVDPPDVLLPDVHHRRIAGRDRRQPQNPAVHRHPLAAYRRRHAPPHAPGDDAGKDRVALGSASPTDSPTRAADNAHRGLPRRDRRAVRAAAGICATAEVRTAGRVCL